MTHKCARFKFNGDRGSNKPRYVSFANNHIVSGSSNNHNALCVNRKSLSCIFIAQGNKCHINKPHPFQKTFIKSTEANPSPYPIELLWLLPFHLKLLFLLRYFIFLSLSCVQRSGFCFQEINIPSRNSELSYHATKLSREQLLLLCCL